MNPLREEEYRAYLLTLDPHERRELTEAIDALNSRNDREHLYQSKVERLEELADNYLANVENLGIEVRLHFSDVPTEFTREDWVSWFTATREKLDVALSVAATSAEDDVKEARQDGLTRHQAVLKHLGASPTPAPTPNKAANVKLHRKGKAR